MRASLYKAVCAFSTAKVKELQDSSYSHGFRETFVTFEQHLHPSPHLQVEYPALYQRQVPVSYLLVLTVLHMQ